MQPDSLMQPPQIRLNSFFQLWRTLYQKPTQIEPQLLDSSMQGKQMHLISLLQIKNYLEKHLILISLHLFVQPMLTGSGL